jgi:hypothetical protein
MTMIVVVQTSDSVWIGADSLRRNGILADESVCKIHETRFGLVTKDGNTEGFNRTGQHYSLDKELSELIETASSSAEFRQIVRDRYIADIYAPMAFLVRDWPLETDPALISSERWDTPIPPITKEMQQRSLLLITNDKGSVKVEHLVLYPDSQPNPSGGFKYFINSPNGKGFPDWRTINSKVLRDESDKKHPCLHQFGLWVNYDRSDAWIQENPEQAIREVLKMAADKFKVEVGPPFVILRVNAPSPT